jgi:hypothetical protein
VLFLLSFENGYDRLYLWLRTAAHLLPLLLHSNDRDMKNSIIINPLREAEAGLMWWNFRRSREKKRTEGDRVGVKWNPIEISYIRRLYMYQIVKVFEKKTQKELMSVLLALLPSSFSIFRSHFLLLNYMVNTVGNLFNFKKSA